MFYTQKRSTMRQFKLLLGLPLLFVFLGEPVFSQKVGPKGGLNLATFTGEDADNSAMKTDFHAGGFAAFGGDGLGGQVELLFSGKGAKNADTDRQTNLSYLSLPLMARYGAGGFSAQFGPGAGYLMGVTNEDGDSFEDYDDFYNVLDLFLNLGAEYTLDAGLKFGGRAQMGLMSTQKEREVLNETVQPDVKNMVIQVYVGYAFGGSGGGRGRY